MCCRYYIEPGSPELTEFGEAARHGPMMERFYPKMAKPLLVSGEISPGSIVPVIAMDRRKNRQYYPMYWGFNILNRPLLANARSETAAQKPTFSNAWQRHRCVIPASWYYEWAHITLANGKKETGDKYLIQPKGSERTWLCGLYRMEEGLPRFVILTREPSEDVSFIHDRMPLMVSEQDIDEWISPEAKPEEVAKRAITELHAQKAG